MTRFPARWPKKRKTPERDAVTGRILPSAPAAIGGQRFGKLVAVVPHDFYIDKKGKHHHRWFCQCDCGRDHVTRQHGLIYGLIRSCGCSKRNPRSHGEGREGHSTPEYQAWRDMRSRCRNPKHRRYKDWGGRGINVCERWAIYENFLADMGQRPTPFHSIERIDNAGNYEPRNCCWATPKEQAANRRSPHEAA